VGNAGAVRRLPSVRLKMALELLKLRDLSQMSVRGRMVCLCRRYDITKLVAVPKEERV
jgi:hypothetical protein